MNQKKDEKWLDDLISRTIDSGKLEFDAEKCRQEYLEEFHALRPRPRQGRATRQRAIWMFIRRSPITKLAAVAAAAMVMASVIWFAPQGSPEVVGEVRNLHGIVRLKNGGSPENVSATANLLAGQWVELLSGSRAEILLDDQSRLLPEPRTIFRVSDGSSGREILLRRGTMAIQAAKQPPGKCLTVRTDGSRIRVLGTKLDVRLVRKPDGTGRTRVTVTSGSVELESCGETVLLVPNTEGIADEGRAPVRRSSNLEVNEMIRLFDKNNELAAQSSAEAGLPVIIDFMGGSSATVWAIVPWKNVEATGTGQYLLRLRHPTFGVEAFALDGVALHVSGKGNLLFIDFSDGLTRTTPLTHLILRIPDVEGLFRAEQGDVFQFHVKAGRPRIVTLFQFRLPESAYIEEISPEPVEMERKLNRLVLTIAADSQAPDVCY
ncbi:MAG: FecR domain-containing protein [Planctomycetota bacterium]|jgi:hypothetical protein